MRHLQRPLNWIQWLTLLLVPVVTVLATILFYRVINVQQQIQQERRSSILTSCADQNQRHDKTIRSLDNIAAKIGKNLNAKQKAELQQQIAYNVELIAALAPRQNCQALADKYVGR